jgi:hypothetical protein
VRPGEALDQLSRAGSRDARTFAFADGAVRVARLATLLALLALPLGLLIGGEEGRSLGSVVAPLGFWAGLLAWILGARVRALIAQRNHIALDGLAFDPIAQLRTSRAFGTHVVGVGAAIVAGVGAAAAWGTGLHAPLAASLAYVAIVALNRLVPIFLAPAGVLADAFEAHRARYRGVPAELPRSLLVRVRCERRAKLRGWGLGLIALGVFGVLWIGDRSGASVRSGAILALLVGAPIVSTILETSAYTRAARNEVRLEGTRLVASDASGPCGAIDLAAPFTYQVLSRVDAEAAYRLDQGAQRIEFTSAASEAPWIVYDVLKLDWPPRDRAAWDAA